MAVTKNAGRLQDIRLQIVADCEPFIQRFGGMTGEPWTERARAAAAGEVLTLTGYEINNLSACPSWVTPMMRVELDEDSRLWELDRNGNQLRSESRRSPLAPSPHPMRMERKNDAPKDE